jgi:quercetin dioxygenase-like cupin family protein
MRYQIDALPVVEVLPGLRARFVHSDSMTFAHWRIDAGAAIPMHAHPHEQVVTMQEGQLELVVAGTRHVLEAGDVVTIPGGVEHSARGITDCRVLDVFQPVREDYRARSQAAF